MALLETPDREEHFTAPDFALKATDGQTYTLERLKGEKGTLILFICNHCPYVKAVIGRLVEDVKILQGQGIGVAAIMSNDTASYPADSFENMKVFAKEHGFTFPYLIDETQQVARAYGAVCTPDIFGFNADEALEYRGRVDSAGPKDADENTVRELREAMLQIARTGTGPDRQSPSMGCSIKWRE
ncbi:MAG: thioredoxin family protein [Rhodospirillales bacterium]|nr:thioredoxin family protein [Rhodospirillales bacterium]MCB9996289.1 thioredoxin family protein [Rhodospirillales bacterium]